MDKETQTKSTFKLRAYQEEIVRLSLEAISNSTIVPCHSIIQLPTGCGKTVCFAEIIRRTQLKTLVLAHREELLTQAKDKIAKSGIDPNAINIVLQSNPDANAMVWVASVQTLVRGNRMDKISPRLIIIDECHHSIASTYKRIIDAFPNVPVLGFTATPTRRTKKEKQELSKIWDKIIYQMSIKAAILQKYLARIIYYKVKTNIDLDAVPISMGDFSETELSNTINVQSRNRACVQKYKELNGGKAIVFCANIAHALNIQKEFQSDNIETMFVSGKTQSEERHAILERFQNASIGENIVIANVGVLTEGFDCPNIRMVILARPTTSPILYIQMLGRGTRIAEGKDSVIALDIVDNCQKRELQNALKTVFSLRHGCQIEGDIVGILKEKHDRLKETGNKEQEETIDAAIDQENIELQLANVLFDMPEELEASSLAWFSPYEKTYFVNLEPGTQIKIFDDMLAYNLYVCKKNEPPELLQTTTNLDALITDVEKTAEQYKETWYCWKKTTLANNLKPSERQIEFLKKIQPDIDASKISRSLASQIIAAYLAKKEARKTDPPTSKQAWLLNRNGIGIPKTKAEASRLISQIKNQNPMMKFAETYNE